MRDRNRMFGWFSIDRLVGWAMRLRARAIRAEQERDAYRRQVVALVDALVGLGHHDEVDKAIAGEMLS